MTDLVLEVQRGKMTAAQRKAKRVAKRAERRAIRSVYLSLMDDIGWTLCSFCKYAKWSGVCEDAYAECHHPVPVVSEDVSGYIDPTTDCWGFRPAVNVSDFADIVGLMLSRFDPEATTWFRRDDGQIVVEGRERREWKNARTDKEMGWPPGTAARGYGAAHMGFPD